MFIKRDIDTFLDRRMFDGKTLIVYGPRQAGKTTSIEHFLAKKKYADAVVRFNGEEAADCALLGRGRSPSAPQTRPPRKLGGFVLPRLTNV